MLQFIRLYKKYHYDKKNKRFDFIDISIFPDWSDQWSKAFNIAKIVTTTVPYCRQEKSYFYVSHLVQQQNVKKTEFLHTNQMLVNGINLYFLKWPTKSRNSFVDLFKKKIIQENYAICRCVVSDLLLVNVDYMNRGTVDFYYLQLIFGHTVSKTMYW